MGWFTKPYSWLTDLAQNIGIRGDRHDAQDTQFVNGISAGWCVDPTVNGSNFTPNMPTVNPNLGGFRITNAADGVGAQDLATVSQLTGATNSPVWGGTFGGTANVVTITLTPALSAYGTGGIYIEGIVGNTNTGNVTVNVNGLGAIQVLKNVNQQLEPGDWTAGQAVQIVYDGTYFRNLSPVYGLLSQNGSAIWGGNSTGTANAQTVTTTPTFTPIIGTVVRWNATYSNTTNSPTLSVNGVTGTIVQNDLDLVTPGQIRGAFIYETIWSGAHWIMLSPPFGTVTQTGSSIFGSDTGGVNTIVVTLFPAVVNLQEGATYRILVANTNTGAVTIDVNGLGAIALTKLSNVALAAGDILADSIIEVSYDGTQFQLLSGLGNTVTTVNTAGLATGGPISDTGTVTVTEATQAQQIAAASHVVAVTPANQQQHPSSLKAWAYFNGLTVGTNPPTSGFNVTSVQRTGTGIYLVTMTNALASANYAVQVTSGSTGGNILSCVSPYSVAPTTSVFQVATYNITAVTLADQPYVYVQVTAIQ
jgi:hypothetical protein